MTKARTMCSCEEMKIVSWNIRDFHKPLSKRECSNFIGSGRSVLLAYSRPNYVIRL